MNLKQNKSYKIDPHITDEYVQFTLPKNILDFFNIQSGEPAFFTIINGNITITTNKPQLFIPAINIKENSFIPQNTSENRRPVFVETTDGEYDEIDEQHSDL